ncbi:MAG: rhodanese-like domain-containing protein [Acidimicrobiia bacterium]|nr:rhodanese-like domain-containing protein [Acidimicrobiia bacterium]
MTGNPSSSPSTVGLRWLVVALVAVVAVLAVGCASGEGAASADEAGLGAAGSDEGPITLLEPDEFEALLDERPDLDLINVHIPYEGHLEGTTHFVDYRELAAWDGLPDDLDAEIVLYCRTGRMSGEVSAELADLGYTDITDLGGGFVAWEQSGRELLLDPTVAE